MKLRTVVQSTIATGLILFAWAVGRAQTSAPAFEFVVDAPGGETTITCVRGCGLAWVERGSPANASRLTTFRYRCTAPRCSSGRVGGWLEE
jgi:hypothetical protein